MTNSESGPDTEQKTEDVTRDPGDNASRGRPEPAEAKAKPVGDTIAELGDKIGGPA